jgi:hypothetical protein
MARPRYIVCSEDRVTDRVTGLVSHFNVIEELTVNQQQAPEEMVSSHGTPWLRMVVTALWSKDDEDLEDDVFEHDMLLHLPGNEKPETVIMGEVKFSARNHRFEMMVAGQPFTVAGTVVFESRLRKKGSFDWLSQKYEIPINVIQRLGEELSS